MSWFSILKIKKQGAMTRHFLLEVFNIPNDVPLNISTNFMHRVQEPNYQDAITESRFEILMQYSRAGLYQEIIDKMNEWFDEQRRITTRLKVNERNRNLSPEEKEARRIKFREYDQRPEVKERKRRRRRGER